MSTDKDWHVEDVEIIGSFRSQFLVRGTDIIHAEIMGLQAAANYINALQERISFLSFTTPGVKNGIAGFFTSDGGFIADDASAPEKRNHG